MTALDYVINLFGTENYKEKVFNISNRDFSISDIYHDGDKICVKFIDCIDKDVQCSDLETFIEVYKMFN